MDLKDYQTDIRRTMRKQRFVIDRVKELASGLRFITREASRLGYSLEELASIDHERQP